MNEWERQRDEGLDRLRVKTKAELDKVATETNLHVIQTKKKWEQQNRQEKQEDRKVQKLILRWTRIVGILAILGILYGIVQWILGFS